MTSRAVGSLLVAATLLACGDDAPAVDAVVVDDTPIDIPDDCDPSTVFFTGELVAWDATVAMPMGLEGVGIVQRGDPTKMGTTMANGSFELCISNDPVVIVDVQPPIGSNLVGGLALVDKDVITGGIAWSIRTFDLPRGQSDYAFDETKGQVYVRVNTAARRVTVSATIDRSYAFQNDEWVSGEDTAQDVFLANVDPTGGETKLVIDRAIGVPQNVPLEPGKITFVVVNAMN